MRPAKRGRPARDGRAAPAGASSARAGSGNENVRRLSVKLVIAVVGCGAMLWAISVLAAWRERPERQALWEAVRACVADYRLTGSPFPCLMVDLSGGEQRGYVVLRAPLGPPDTVLSPTRRVVGVEDPWLQSPQAPNYFEDAWNARSLVKTANGEPPPRDEIALAVNAAPTRTQDQLHIHLGCLIPRLKRRLLAFAPRLPIGVWTRAGAFVPGSALWAYRTGRADLAGVEPFRLAAEGLGGKIRDRAQLLILVAGLRIADNDELVILASAIGAPGATYRVGAEDILDLQCAEGAN